MNQNTISKAASVEGVGLHSGKNVKITLHPAPVNHGFKFRRVDLPDSPIIIPDVSQVVSTNRGTTICSGNVEVATVEHLLSGLAGMGIDNVMIDVSGPEIPILDGSALPFVNLVKSAGIEKQKEERKIFELKETVRYHDPETGTEILAMPSEEFEVTALIDFDSPVLGPQYANMNGWGEYEENIAPCRTFVFVHELSPLLDQGLIKGGDLDNAVVIANEVLSEDELDNLAKKLGKEKVSINKGGVINTTQLKFQNEPARHKLLDIIGDLTLLGDRIKARIVANKPGHKANVEFAKLLKLKLLEDRKLKGKPVYNPDEPPVLDIEDVKTKLPHRFPFLLVDKVIKIEENMIVGIKNVTGNESFFQGHFPGNAVFPGVLQIEALAQTGGILALSKVEDPENWNTYFIKIDNTKFKHKVVPGDTIILKMELINPIRRGICQMRGTAYVGNKIVSEGELTAQIVKNT